MILPLILILFCLIFNCIFMIVRYQEESYLSSILHAIGFGVALMALISIVLLNK